MRVGRAPSTDEGSRPGGAGGRRARRLLVAARLVGPLLALAVGILAALFLLSWQEWAAGSQWPRRLSLALLLLSLTALAVFVRRLYRRLLDPLLRLEVSVARICQGEPGSSETLRDLGVLDGLAGKIAALNAELTELSEDMDSRVARQTMRLAQKTASLKILYDVAADINRTESVDELVLRYLRVIKEMVNGRAATVHLAPVDGSWRLAGAIGPDGVVRQGDALTPVDLCLCGTVLSPGDILCRHRARFCSRHYGRRMFDADEIAAVTVPIEHHDELLGVYRIFVERPGVGGREDIMELLFSIGRHLGLAVAKLRSDAAARRLSRLDERNTLAHELHDSLAQTLASLRFQVRMLDDALQPGDLSQAVRRDLGRLRSGLDEANAELRELLYNFRAPMDRRGLAPALEKLTGRFRRETGVHILFQNDCRSCDLPAATELQVLRIAQESLANVRKHARAHTVRVLLTRRGQGTCLLLVEDDGIGFRVPRTQGRSAEHLGCAIMAERAARIGADWSIESEPGEGTRVELTFPLR